jgi:anti-sigma B factor antagonist
MSELIDQLRLFITNTGPHARLEVGGELDAGNVHTLQDHLGLVIAAGTGGVDVDMAGVTFCDSSGLAALVAAQRQLRDAGRVLCVVNASPQVERLLAISGLHDVLQPAAGAADPAAPLR